MLTDTERAEVMKMIAEAKKELRKEIWDASDKNHSDKCDIKSDVSDNTEAILELSELIPTEE